MSIISKEKCIQNNTSDAALLVLSTLVLASIDAFQQQEDDDIVSMTQGNKDDALTMDTYYPQEENENDVNSAEEDCNVEVRFKILLTSQIKPLKSDTKNRNGYTVQ